MKTNKYYRLNERNIMSDFGFNPTYNSGSGWIEKEDGQSKNAIAQLKSTSAESIIIKLSDLEILEKNAAISHKRPVFIIQFLTQNKKYLVLPVEDDLINLIHGEQENHFVEIENPEFKRLRVIEGNIGEREKIESERIRRHEESKNAFKSVLRESQSQKKPKRNLNAEF